MLEAPIRSLANKHKKISGIYGFQGDRLGMQHLKLEILTTEVAGYPTLINYLEANFAGVECALPELLITKAEESPYPMRQWVEALLVFDQWLVTRRLSLPIANQISYVACSAEGGSAYATLTQLPVQVYDMLETYGCDDAETEPPSSGTYES